MLTLVAIGLFFVLAAFAVTFVVVRAIAGGRFYLRFRGKRLVTCPETQRTVAVEVDEGEAVQVGDVCPSVQVTPVQR